MQTSPENKGKWRPFTMITPSERLRAACASPPPWMQARAAQRLKSPPELPTSEPPPLDDPEYELIEMPGQQEYINTTKSPNTSALSQKDAERRKYEGKKCDLCGSVNAKLQCESCAGQSFCLSCDLMYHKHPKRQMHIRKQIKESTINENNIQPPLPPKGSLSVAPVPPPRRNKRTSKNPMFNSSQQVPCMNKKENQTGIVGSLRRFVGNVRSNSNSSTTSRSLRSDSTIFKHPQQGQFQKNFNQYHGDNRYTDWDSDHRNRSGSFSVTNGPTFPSMMQAHSMAQLNCLSCHHHGSPWDWNRSHMNINSFQPWSGMPPGGGAPWHGSVIFPSPYRQDYPAEFSRKNSLRQHAMNRRMHRRNSDEDSTSEISVSDCRRSQHRGTPPTRNVSPALSRRSRKTLQTDSEDDKLSKRSTHRHRRRSSPVLRDPSPALSRRNYKKRYDEDAMSVKSTTSRRSRKSPLANKSLHRNLKYVDSSDSDDELTSEKEGTNTTEALATISQMAEKSNKSANQTVSSPQLSTSLEAKNNDEKQWQCEHCTFVNSEKKKVCEVCCKTRNTGYSKDNEIMEEELEESVAEMNISSDIDGRCSDKDKGKKNTLVNKQKFTSTGTSPPPQNISTQTYDCPLYTGKLKRTQSLENYDQWKPIKRSNSKTSFYSDTQECQLISKHDRKIIEYEIPIKDRISSSENKQHSSTHSLNDDQPNTSKHGHFPNPPDYMSFLLDKQVKQGLEIVKLLREAEKYHFTADDLTAALMQCGEENPVKWLLDNWNKMIDTVVTLATDYGNRQKDNIIGTLSTYEAREALRAQKADVWAAVSDCVRQRQNKYAEIMSRGNFSREDVVTVLTANHGDVEAACNELNKSQLKPFLMRIWGPPQGSDNESGHHYKFQNIDKIAQGDEIDKERVSNNDMNNVNFHHVQSWLQSVESYREQDVSQSLDDEYHDNKQISPLIITDPLGKNNENPPETTVKEHITKENDPVTLQNMNETIGNDELKIMGPDLSDPKVTLSNPNFSETSNDSNDKFTKFNEDDTSNNTIAIVANLTKQLDETLKYLDQHNNCVSNAVTHLSSITNINLERNLKFPQGNILTNNNKKDENTDFDIQTEIIINEKKLSSNTEKENLQELESLALLVSYNLDHFVIELDKNAKYGSDDEIFTNNKNDKINDKTIKGDYDLLNSKFYEIEENYEHSEICEPIIDEIDDAIKIDNSDITSSYSDTDSQSFISLENDTQDAIESINLNELLDTVTQHDVEAKIEENIKLEVEEFVGTEKQNVVVDENPRIYDSIKSNERFISDASSSHIGFGNQDVLPNTNQENDDDNCSTITKSSNDTLYKNENTSIIQLLENKKNDAQACNLPINNSVHLIPFNTDNNLSEEFKREVRQFLAEGLVTTYNQAELAVQLMNLQFDRKNSVDAAVECSTLETAISYLQQECQLCATKLSAKQMISMLECEHRCCVECASQFFSVQITERSINDCVCPFCKKPNIMELNSDQLVNYFSNMDIVLKSILPVQIHELFQSRLRDQTLMQEPNFKWCSRCSSGFIWNADAKHDRLICPDCKCVSCANCGKMWTKEHTGKTCQEYETWLRESDPEVQLAKHMDDYGITCPKCATRFALVRGGCMHLTCTRCKHEFCSDCCKPFVMGNNCTLSEYCDKLGLHAHHPRNCLFYLRDKEPQELQNLLTENNVIFKSEEDGNVKCMIQLQRETDNGFLDTTCGAKVQTAGLCKTHYVEYLVKMIRKNKIDPVSIFDLAEVLQEFRRRGKPLPIRVPNTFEHQYRDLCIKIVKEEIPME